MIKDIYNFYSSLFSYSKIVIGDILQSFTEIPYYYVIITSVGLFFGTIWNSLYMFVLSTIFLTFLDTHLGIKASKKLGKNFNSKIRRKGLIEKSQIYLMIIAIGISVDYPLNQLYDIGNLYVTMILSLFMIIYEVTSIIEKLEVLHPDKPIIQFLGRLFMLIKTETENKVINKIEKMEEIIKKSKEDEK